MYLKSIEVQGFKSFANKLVFEFHQGITGIVGPNGSGKSNVADAVRWVLGEQSAKSLRSGNMQDVIFAGTELRKPLSFASVAITFDNEDRKLPVDFPEITVTRKLYRSGESEYLLNNVPVRLKEIKDIFYDTGIGKEGYSIIGQGQVEKILNGKPEERRELFDEAAGIVKFKKRKKEALKKLADEQQNLLRVNDILSELTGQLEPLKKQSASARIYLDAKENLKRYDVNLFLLEETRVEKQLSEIAGRTEIAEHDSSDTRERFDRTKEEYEQVERSIEALDQEAQELNEAASKQALILQQLHGQIDLLHEQITSITKSGEQYALRRAQIMEDLAAKEKEAEEKQEAYESGSGETEKIRSEEQSASDALQQIENRINEINNEIEQAKNEVISMLNQRASVKGKIQRFDTMLEQMGIRKAEINGRLLRMRENESSAASEAEDFDTQERTVQDEQQKVQEKYDGVSAEIDRAQKQLSEANSRLETLQSNYHRDASRLKSLEAMAERYEGYNLGTRKIMEQARSNPGIRGIVADLIEVPKEYEQAIEIALGGSVRNIVTDNEATAKYMIEFLKRNRFGRVTFLPLTSLRARDFGNREILQESGVVGIASDLVSAGEGYENLLKYLLGRILVVDHVDTAIRLGRKYHHSVYMVTLQGESFAPGGSMTGGAFKNQENLLGRKREIDDLTVNVKKWREEYEALKQQTEQEREKRNQLREQLTQLNDENQKLRLKLNTVQMSRRQADENLRINKINRAALEKENSEIDQQMAEVREKSRDITKSLESSEETESEINLRTESLREELASLQNDRESAAHELEQIHLRSASLSEKSRYQKELLDRLNQEIHDLRAEAESIDETVAGSDSESEEKKRQIQELEETIRAGEEESSVNKQRKTELQDEKQKLSESHRDFFEKRDELSQRLADLDKELYRLNAQKERLEEARESSAAYMWDEYELTPSQVHEILIAEFIEDRQAVKKEINRLKDQIRRLGSVNVNAIEDYKNLLERHTFLAAQHEDLIQSEETLKGIIDELDSGMRKQFSEKFAAIQTEFDKAFKELFGGGKGTLSVDTETDVLEADISIIAHPPGKKLQNMMQLSGGEKALTAIALLFAIQNLKPSPFCLLDEIEAALDDSNVTRYAQYLHKLTKNTQFIVITHRRGTMTAADRLYGITMQEKGVSTLVSVNLIEDSLSK